MDRLGVLVRGYAHLGRLTELHWNGSAKVFKARSLLYAQRRNLSQRVQVFMSWVAELMKPHLLPLHV